MKFDQEAVLHWLAVMAISLCFVISHREVTATKTDHLSMDTMLDYDQRLRVRRQAGHRNRSLLSLLSEYIAETRNDTRRAFNQISELVSKQIVPVQQGIQLNTTLPSSGRELPDDDVTTTEAPFTVSQSEFFRIIRRNLRGLARLFNTESRKALQDSNNNVREIRKQFMNVVRPFVATNATSFTA